MRARVIIKLVSMNKILIAIFLVGSAGVLPAEADNDSGMRIASAARVQIGVTVRYDPEYQSIEYPNGDIPLDRGVCTDVIVRSFRTGLGVDLQKFVHEDMKRNLGE